ncbi:glycosyltransferase involved in cell wall biosynthesis [Pedobacter cryoconitis]|uniref:glycosyltransferase family 2 protein n=1 Tax=Pedobacter cryoconitis TaxID=188932 RepID=UPI001614CCB1|nr:glycosyltransferase family A protein [Pedobacter cryoconitis]MBB6270425.1 glycosyltransferase involved in cell wall biosynthesis [Pedobacter cryoconitis]
MNLPLVSCIMPTANREKFMPFAINYFMSQNYRNKELVIIDDGKESVAHLIPEHPSIRYFYTDPIGTIGLKRNYACEKARGEIIIHLDDDDWYAQDWITQQVNYLLKSGADMCGIQHIHYYSIILGKLYTVIRQYEGGGNPMDWVAGGTLAYWKSFWEKHPFKDLQQGEDDDFIQKSGGKLLIHDYRDGFVALLHPHNTVVRSFENPKHKALKS